VNIALEKMLAFRIPISRTDYVTIHINGIVAAEQSVCCSFPHADKTKRQK